MAIETPTTDDDRSDEQRPGVESTELLCIGCPLGCHLTIEHADGDIIEVRGFRCRKGDRFAREELTAPVRNVSTTIGIRGARLARLPVQAGTPVPKESVRRLCERARPLVVDAPITLGDVVATVDLDGAVIDLVATRSLPAS
jgi:CxxC motif-containing protein